ncbi:transposase [Mucilaginibacter ginsenosidivorax]|uniref:Transposase n=1 Tax=Mucilaginibacter ginsenosidivorax TaxID=862126 RepID=A0A5B8WBC4_9SPHI|nr:transposase [Mucilaginibacter ginsenosidivorax]
MRARRVVFKDPATQKELAFITNEPTLAPEQIAALYKKRWQIELLFKRIKQRYPLRYFLGDNVNAIQIQVWSMLICDLLVQIVLSQVNKAGKRKWSYANLAAMVKHHLMTYINLMAFLFDPEKALLNYKPPEPTAATLF